MYNKETDKEKWNDRYQKPEFAFGTEPNVFFKEWILKFKIGRLLLPAEGEGRNAVYAAQQGWQVTAFDLSVEGKNKAMQLANQKGVTIEYAVSDLEDMDLTEESVDAVGLIYAHFHYSKKATYHKKLNESLKQGGIMIFEAFSKEHLALRINNPDVGGPTDSETLYSEQEIKEYFTGFEIIYLNTETIALSEGKYHNGKASVVRFVGKKL